MLIAAVSKEARIIFRDMEALAILFILPSSFVLIMSLALQDAFHEQAGVKFSMLVVNKDSGEIGKSMLTTFEKNHSLDVILPGTKRYKNKNPDADTILKETNDGQYQFAIIIPEATTRLAKKNAELLFSGNGNKKNNVIEIRFFVDPAVRGDHRSVIVATLNRAIKEIENKLLINAVRSSYGNPGKGKSVDLTKNKESLISEITDPFGKNETDKPSPTSVQQNAPGWGLLAMFFLVIPLAGTLFRVQYEGSLQRLKTMAAPMTILLAGKMVPYFIINQIQMLLILLLGYYVLPLLGGEKLELGPHPLAIIPLSSAISLAAIGYGLMVAAFCRTSEQATTFGATSILILGALGGIMVPKIVMPPVMQEITVLSPMSWGLDGFLAIFVRGVDAGGIAREAGVMLVFGLVCFLIGITRFNYKTRST